jgi:hypothetical protein
MSRNSGLDVAGLVAKPRLVFLYRKPVKLECQVCESSVWFGLFVTKCLNEKLRSSEMFFL